MSKFPLVQSSFEEGWSSDIKQGPAGSFWYSRHLDFRKAPSQMSILPATTKISSTTVTGLITDMVQLPSGAKVAIDSSGGVYQISTSDVFTKNGTTLSSTAYGMVYNLQQDTIYVPGVSTMHSITNADGRFGGAFTVNEGTFAQTADQASTLGHANTYTTTNAISEIAVDKLSITPAIEPLYSVKIWVTTKGSDAVTVTMHDAVNNTLGTATLAAGSMTNGAYNEFVFSTPVRMLVKPNAATYHFHVTHATSSATTIGSGTVNDFSTADYSSRSNFFVNPTNGFHPAIEFLQYLCFGNERYLSVWEPISQSSPLATEYLRHRLTFPSGYQVTSLATWNEYLAIACEKRSTSSTNEFQEGKIFLWQGTSSTYDTFIDVPEGAPYGLFSSKTNLYWFANGKWWAYSGGEPVPLFQMPNTDFEYSSLNTYMVNYPHTMTMRNGMLLGAFPSETNSTSIEHAIYSFGRRNKNYPDSFGLSYSPSHGTLTNGTLRLGMIKNFGDRLYLAWRNGATYGVDKVDPNSVPFSTATWEGLITDSQIISVRRRFPRPDQDKSSTELKIIFKPLPSGATITPKYKINREASWELGTPVSALNATEASINIIKRYKEAQVGFDATATATTPEILAVIHIIDSLPSELD